MSTNENAPCECAELVRDYAFDELAPAERKSMEQHFASCSGCAAELDRLRLTTAVLRVLPDVEVPRRIAFVSDSPVNQTLWSTFWNSAARLGFASACVLAAGLSFAAYHRSPQPNTTTAQTVSMSPAEFNAAIDKAVALAVDKREKDLMLAVSSSIDIVQRQNQMITHASFVDVPTGVRQ